MIFFSAQKALTPPFFMSYYSNSSKQCCRSVLVFTDLCSAVRYCSSNLGKQTSFLASQSLLISVIVLKALFRLAAPPELVFTALVFANDQIGFAFNLSAPGCCSYNVGVSQYAHSGELSNSEAREKGDPSSCPPNNCAVKQLFWARVQNKGMHRVTSISS